MARKKVDVAIVVTGDYGVRNNMQHVGGDVMSGALVENQRQRRLQFDDCIPNGVVAQTANGTSFDTGTGWNRNEPWSSGQIEPRGPWPAGKSNRGGE
jgi:hypothetical protein